MLSLITLFTFIVEAGALILWLTLLASCTIASIIFESVSAIGTGLADMLGLSNFAKICRN
jgi:Trk-type K+ transport system membrane component